MGLIQHDCLIYTGFSEESRNEAMEFVRTRDDKRFFAISPVVNNGYWTMIVFPDGSKEGWNDSNRGDIRRQDVKTFLSDKGGYLVECSFGELGISVKYNP